MKIAIMSDSHDNYAVLEKAVSLANEESCEYLLFAGDLISPPALAVLEKFEGKIKFVWGNNEGEIMGLTRKMDASAKTELCGDIYEGEIDGVKIFMNHYPRIAELAAGSGEYDLCIHGHIHEYREENIGETILLNPGGLQVPPEEIPTFVIFDTDIKKVTKKEIK